MQDENIEEQKEIALPQSKFNLPLQVLGLHQFIVCLILPAPYHL